MVQDKMCRKLSKDQNLYRNNSDKNIRYTDGTVLMTHIENKKTTGENVREKKEGKGKRDTSKCELRNRDVRIKLTI